MKEKRVFQVGDKVRCLNANRSEPVLNEGKIYTVCELLPYGRIHLKEFEDDQAGYYDEHRFELVERADNLDVLIEQANEVMVALHEHADQLEYQPHNQSKWLPLGPSFGVSEIRRKAPALPAPFTLKDSGYEVSFPNANEVKVGCQTFKTDYLKTDLSALIKENLSESFQVGIVATKNGPNHKGNTITWADAEQLLAALEKTGSK